MDGRLVGLPLAQPGPGRPEQVKLVLALAAALFLVGCAGDSEEYSGQQDSPTVHLAKPAGEPGAAIRETF
jgi:hypothetical protein